MAGAIYHGVLASDARHWSLLPEGRVVAGEAGRWVFEGADAALAALLDTLYAYEGKGHLPFGGGLYEQPSVWYQAMLEFKRGPGYYKSNRQAVGGTIQRLMSAAKENR